MKRHASETDYTRRHAAAACALVDVRRRGVVLQRQQQRRNLSLGGHHGPPPEWSGIDKVVRGYFPEDYQCTCRMIPDSVSLKMSHLLVLKITHVVLCAVAIAILSFYGGLVAVYKISSAFSTKKPVVIEVAKPITEVAPTGVPSMDSPAFEKFVESEAFELLLSNDEQLNKLMNA